MPSICRVYDTCRIDTHILKLVSMKLEGIIPFRVDKSQNQIQIETSNTKITPTTAQTLA